MFFKKRTPMPTKAQMLSARPLRNPLIVWEASETGALLRAPIDNRGIWGRLRRIFRLRDERLIELDAIGAFVWDRLDGHTTVDGLIVRLCKQYRLDRKEAEASLFAFLKMLSDRNYAALFVKKR